MNKERWKAFMRDDDDSLKLSPEEIKAGWHFCWDWDGLLIGPGMGETKACTCVPPTKD